MLHNTYHKPDLDTTTIIHLMTQILTKNSAEWKMEQLQDTIRAEKSPLNYKVD